MPNRGPITVSSDDLATLLRELPPHMDPKDAEDNEERQRFAKQDKIRSALEAATAEGGESGKVVLAIDEIDELLDCLPPPPSLAAVREKLAELRRSLL